MGSVAGIQSASPVFKSNLAKCLGHTIQLFSNFPSEIDSPSWLHISSKAYISDPIFVKHISVSLVLILKNLFLVLEFDENGDIDYIIEYIGKIQKNRRCVAEYVE